MNVDCQWVRNYLPLFLYQELSFEEEEWLQSHLGTCEACRTTLAAERELHEAFNQADEQLPVGLLNGCREQLATRVAAEQARPANGWMERVRAWFTPRMVLRPVAGLALVALGFFGAGLMPRPPQDAFVTSVTDPVATRVRRVEPVGTGRFQIVLDETRQRIVLGSPEDDPIKQLLISAASEPSDPALRGEMIEILSSSVAPCDETRQALLQAMETDSNDGVRLRAMEALKPMSHEADVRRVLARVLLKDPNAGVRTKAIDLLTANQGGVNMIRENEMVGVFQDLLGREPNQYIRMQAQRQLQQVKASTEVY